MDVETGQDDSLLTYAVVDQNSMRMERPLSLQKHWFLMWFLFPQSLQQRQRSMSNMLTLTPPLSTLKMRTILKVRDRVELWILRWSSTQGRCLDKAQIEWLSFSLLALDVWRASKAMRLADPSISKSPHISLRTAASIGFCPGPSPNKSQRCLQSQINQDTVLDQKGMNAGAKKNLSRRKNRKN